MTRGRKLVQCGSCPRQVDVRELEREDDDVEEETASCRLCVVVERLERVEADNSALAKRVTELEAELSTERESRRAVERKLEVAEQELVRVVISENNDERLEASSNAEACSEAAHGDTNTLGNSYAHVLKDRQSKSVAEQVGRKEQHVADTVIIAGDSNVARCSTAIMERVEGDKRVKVGCFPGEKMQTVMAKAKGQLAMSSQGRNLVVIAAGLNDVLEGEEGKLGQEIAKGVKDLRATAPNVLISVCTVPEVTKQGVHTERVVLAANSEIRRCAKDLGFEVININRVVGSIGHRQAFQRDGIHFNPRAGNEVGWRLGGRAVAFLGGTAKLRKEN